MLIEFQIASTAAIFLLLLYGIDHVMDDTPGWLNFIGGLSVIVCVGSIAIGLLGFIWG